MVQMLLDQLAAHPVGAKVQGALLTKEDLARVVKGERSAGGVFILLTTDPRWIAHSVHETRQAVAQGGDVRALDFPAEPEGNHG